MSDQLTDGRGLVISTANGLSAGEYVRGVELLLAGSAEAVNALRAAVEADPGFDLARIALAFALIPPESTSSAITTTRRERQHIEVVKLVLSGNASRGAVLGREHLREFPDDVLVAHVLRSRGLT